MPIFLGLLGTVLEFDLVGSPMLYGARSTLLGLSGADNSKGKNNAMSRANLRNKPS